MSLEQVRRDWTRLGAEDPLWAVLVEDGKRGGRWDVEEFLALGRKDVARSREDLARLGLPVRWHRVLDFGCGAGRLSQALAQHADEVVGVDVSAPMLDTARRLDRSGGRCTFLLTEHSDLREIGSGSVDLVYSERVLQHLPRPALESYVGEFLRVLRAGGVAVLHCPTRPQWTLRGVVWRTAPFPVVAWLQRRVLGYPAPMRMTGVPEQRMAALVTAAGGELLAALPMDERATNWRACRYVVRKAGG
ncbi:class I SAM-dependent methyltransferase [Blastococcus sp. VKM Ac-2987]|uniref:class I SAM-dependent methyltransferase n=1 Tax=Blastococcus sp. VKM Ac-2987 TaxID=3004141 RepID=UPI0022ABBD79|nr:class I SAM-dependent methyltransferase [Blastococcus sp. VKM Ac-2987]MCZ2860380.1 class I SAM-dependent methyltransferase [Blastococcus sp. VKM Ac-2987]